MEMSVNDAGAFDLDPSSNSLMALERYRNDGSPSGFSDVNTTSPGHRPSDLAPYFPLPMYDCSDLTPHRIGERTKIPQGLYPVHPDMVDRFEHITKLRASLFLKAAPTSSPRTLFVGETAHPLFIKLPYQGLIGRVTRRMTRRHVLSAIEVSRCLTNAITSGEFPRYIQIMNEYSGLFFDENGPLADWGFVERNPFIENLPGKKLVPAFSMFSTVGGTVLPILHQIINTNPYVLEPDEFFRLLLLPIIDIYFELVVKLGLQPEAHAQNILYALDDNDLPIAAVLRDMESVDKDIGVMEYFGISLDISDFNYKTLRKTDYNYQIMHSFMFDFKFGQYLLGPMIDCWGMLAGNPAIKKIETIVKTYVREKSMILPVDYFPKNVWYNYDAVVHEKNSKRKYNQISNPRFR